jgi:hypothetical protein
MRIYASVSNRPIVEHRAFKTFLIKIFLSIHFMKRSVGAAMAFLTRYCRLAPEKPFVLAI